MNHQPLRRAQRRRGFFSMELVMTLPILGLVLMAMLEFTMLFFARGSVVTASRIAARKASLPGVTADDVEAEVRRVLEPRLQGRMQVGFEAGERTGDVVTVAIQVPMNAASPDLLWPIGYSLSGRHLYAETRMIRE